MAWRVIVLLGALLLTGCAPSVSVDRVPAASTLERDRRSVLTGDGLSEVARIALRVLDLEESYRDDPIPTMLLIRDRAIREPDGSWRMAAAEMALDQAERARARTALGRWRGDPALYLTAAELAWRQLGHDFERRALVLDGYTEHAADLYNRAVAEFVSLTNDHWTGSSEPVVYEGPLGVYRVTAVHGDGDVLWDPARFDWFRPTEGYRIEGMRNHHRFDGFGATLLAFRENRPGRADEDPFMPPEGESYPATGVLRFDEVSPGAMDVRVELFNTLSADRTEVAGRAVPLSRDHTVPVAYLFSLTELGEEGLKGLFEVEDYLDRLGIYMHQPYDPERVPVLFVHGLRSSPITWRDVLNDLLADEEIRRRCQFWMFLYPTGLPFPTAAADLRRELTWVRDYYDPIRTDPGPRDMLVIGHSMGGLISRGLVQDMRDDTLFESVYGRPLGEMELSASTTDLMQRIFYYGPDADVRRVVFVASPLKGATLAQSWLGRLGSSLVELPERLVRVTEELEAYEPEGGWWHGRSGNPLPTSIETLRPDAPTFAVYNSRPIVVPHHTIIGVQDGGTPSEGSDGVVPYWSASVESAESELIVRSGHNAHAEALAIREMRRIIRLHLDEIDARAPAASASD
jgi:pimeloyl-ACP methyl ester carboxylesterase